MLQDDLSSPLLLCANQNTYQSTNSIRPFIQSNENPTVCNKPPNLPQCVSSHNCKVNYNRDASPVAESNSLNDAVVSTQIANLPQKNDVTISSGFDMSPSLDHDMLLSGDLYQNSCTTPTPLLSSVIASSFEILNSEYTNDITFEGYSSGNLCQKPPENSHVLYHVTMKSESNDGNLCSSVPFGGDDNRRVAENPNGCPGKYDATERFGFQLGQVCEPAKIDNNVIPSPKVQGSNSLCNMVYPVHEPSFLSMTYGNTANTAQEENVSNYILTKHESPNNVMNDETLFFNDDDISRKNIVSKYPNDQGQKSDNLISSSLTTAIVSGMEVLNSDLCNNVNDADTNLSRDSTVLGQGFEPSIPDYCINSETKYPYLLADYLNTSNDYTTFIPHNILFDNSNLHVECSYNSKNNSLNCDDYFNIDASTNQHTCYNNFDVNNEQSDVTANLLSYRVLYDCNSDIPFDIKNNVSNQQNTYTYSGKGVNQSMKFVLSPDAGSLSNSNQLNCASVYISDECVNVINTNVDVDVDIKDGAAQTENDFTSALSDVSNMSYQLLHDKIRFMSLNVGSLLSKLRFPELVNRLKHVDVACFQETHLDDLDNVEIDGFTFFAKNRQICKKKSGGIALAVRNELLQKIRIIENVSKRNKVDKSLLSHYRFVQHTVSECMIVFEVDTKNDNFVGSVVYIPPEQSPYFNRFVFDEIEETLLHIDSDKMILLGDFNARTASLDDFVTVDNDEHTLFDEPPDLMALFNVPRKRSSCDNTTNNHGNRLIDVCTSLSLNIVNGRIEPDKNKGKLTCKDTSLVDYALASPYIFPFLSFFHVGDFDKTLSDAHCPIFLTLDIDGDRSDIDINDRNDDRDANTNVTKPIWKK